jgi:hypothetical protein
MPHLPLARDPDARLKHCITADDVQNAVVLLRGALQHVTAHGNIKEEVFHGDGGAWYASARLWPRRVHYAVLWFAQMAHTSLRSTNHVLGWGHQL